MRLPIIILISLLPLFVFSQQVRKPNIIIILADDLGWGDVGFHGSTIKTPNIDRLSKEGVVLNRYYTAPICSPTRAGLLTGRYPNRFGIRETTIPPWSDFGLDTSEQLLPEMLAQVGYKHRALIGKWHLGHLSLQYHPMRRGFTHFYGHLNGAIDYFTHKREGEVDWQNDYQPSKDTGYSTNLLTDETIKSIQAYSKEKAPFFLYVAFNAPHGPLQAPEEDLLENGFDPAKPRFKGLEGGDESAESGDRGHGNTPRQTYAAMVSNMDKGIGRILQALKQLGIEDNTLVLFHSDNGAAGNGRVASHGNLRGYKFDEWEGGVRAPAIIKWPAAKITGGKHLEQVMGYIDVVPTLRDITGLASAPRKPFDGLSMWPVINGSLNQIDRLFYLGHGAIIDGNWKLVSDQGIPKMGMTSGDALFNLPPDYGEVNDLRKAEPAVYTRLKKTVTVFDAIKAPKEILTKGPKGNFKAPKDWTITR